MDISHAFVTLVTTNSYLPGALALAASLKDLHASLPKDFHLVCLVTPESLEEATIQLLRRVFDVVVGVETIQEKTTEANLHLMGRPDLGTALTKIHVFRLIQYSKILFLDADVLPLRPLSHLFKLPYEFAAVPDVGWPDIFNSGVMLLTPGNEKFEALRALMSEKGSWDGADQGLLNEWRGDNWHRLSFTYNTTPTAVYTYAPAYTRFGSQINAVHFIGPNKPWMDIPYRTPGSSAQEYQVALASQASVSKSSQVLTQPQAALSVPSSSSVAQAPSLPHATDALAPMDFPNQASSSISIVPSSSISASPYSRPPVPATHIPHLPAYDYASLVDRWFAVYDTHYRSQTFPPEDDYPTEHYIATWDEQAGIEAEMSTSTPLEYAMRMLGLNSWQKPARSPSIEGRESSYFPEEGEYITMPLDGRSELLRLPSEQYTSSSDSPDNRAPSPPLLSWNPAVDPPPAGNPATFNFPSDTYYPNVWDLSPSRENDRPPESSYSYSYYSKQQSQSHSRQSRPTSRHARSPLSSPPNSSTFFEPPPLHEIPKGLIQQGQYQNVTGRVYPGDKPHPDANKVKRVFPWEANSRHAPRRVFPTSDPAPSPRYVSIPSQSSASPSQSSQLDTEQFSSPPSVSVAGFDSPVISPRLGSLNMLSYTNAWDTVSGIQKYADRLVKPPSRSQPTWEDREDSKRRGRDTHVSEYKWQDDGEDLSSRDGDVESEGEESGPETTSARKPRRRNWRDRSMELDSGDDIREEAEEQRIYESDRARDRTHTGRRSTTPSASRRDRSGYKRLGFSPRASPIVSADVSPSSESPLREPPPMWGDTASPTILQSPITLDQYPSTTITPSVPRPEPGSSPSSSTASPRGLSGTSQPKKPAGRVFDPARGVDVFKRGSEEVLARFLRMSPGSFDDSERGRTTPQPQSQAQN